MLKSTTPSHVAMALLLKMNMANDVPAEYREDVEDFIAMPSDGADAITFERDGQRTREDYDATHDDEHTDGALAMAAAAYASYEADPQNARVLWPWGEEYWKPKTDRENLVRAGALIAAEIDRIDRALRKDARLLLTDPGAPKAALKVIKKNVSNRSGFQAPDEGVWADCLRISEIPAVDETIRTFREDQTEDNCVCMVRAIRAQIAPPLYRPAVAELKAFGYDMHFQIEARIFTATLDKRLPFIPLEGMMLGIDNSSDYRKVVGVEWSEKNGFLVTLDASEGDTPEVMFERGWLTK